MRMLIPTRSALLGALVAIGGASAMRAQNPISSKVVGSDVARRNRRLYSRFFSDTLRLAAASRGQDSATAAFVKRQADELKAAGVPVNDSALRSLALHLPVGAVRRLMAGEVAEYLKLTNPADTVPLSAESRFSKLKATCVGVALGAREMPITQRDTLSPTYLLELLCASSELSSVVPNALRLSLTKILKGPDGPTAGGIIGSDAFATDGPLVELIASDALARVLRAVEKGHTNPQRLYLGGQLGLGLVGGKDEGIAGRASIRAAYFIPISPLSILQLPVVTNIGDIAAAPKDSQQVKLKKVTTSSEGAFVSLEPTFDPVFIGRLKDVRIQPFFALGGQLNTLRDKADTKDVQFAQGRVGGGTNLEIGIPSPGHPSLFMSSRLVWRLFSPAASQEVFGTRNRGTPVVESFALIPIGGGTSILGEVSATRGNKPVVRIALWSQASPQKGGQ